MDLLLRAADVTVSKPGGLTVAEALACGRPMLATFSLGGQESFNLNFLERHGVGGIVPLKDLAERLDRLFRDTSTLTSLQRRAWHLGRRDGAERIADMICDTANGVLMRKCGIRCP
jgi:UDP-N-acetylglucosamine:LPS N-acetylglucosamine transferase